MKQTTHMLLLLVLTVTIVSSQETASTAKSAIQFRDTTGTEKTAKIGWTGDAESGHFFVQTPNEGKVLRSNEDGIEVDGTVKADKFSGDGSGLTNLPEDSITVDKVTGLNGALGKKADTGWVKERLVDHGIIVDTASITARLNGKADTGWVADALGKKADTATLSSKISGKADTGWVKTKINEVSGLSEIPDGSIESSKLSDSSVTTSKIHNEAVTTGKIANAAITQEKIDAGVTTPPSGSAGGSLTGNYPNPDIADGAITGSKIADGEITSGKLAPDVTFPPSGSAGGALTGSYPSPGIANDAIDSSKIVEGGISGSDIDPGTRLTVGDLLINGGEIQIGQSVGGITQNWWEFGLDDGATGTGIDFHGGSTLTDYAARIYRFAGDDGNFDIINQGNGKLGLYTNNTERVTIFGNGDVGIGGNVGVGTNTPSSKLTITNGADAKLKLYTTSGSVAVIDAVANTDENVGRWLSINPSGDYVGIGTTSPSAQLDVNGNLHVNGTIIGPVENGGAYIQGRLGHRFSVEWTGNTGPHELNFWIDSQPVKTFVIDHPVKKDKYLVHATLEGPEATVFYRGTTKLENGYAEIALPDYFEALTRPENRTVQLTNIGGFDRIAVKKQDGSIVKNGKFIVISDNVYSEQEFNWEVKAERNDVPPLDVEPDKNNVTVKGDGPYTYIDN